QANAPGDECRKFPTNDPNVIRDAILALKNDPDFRQHMSTCARERAETFAWPRIAAETVACYEKAIAQRKAR
ncbi:MAG: glycosyltransferase involved in cell wall biosynthesis, partial [Kiritimatiellia bacterium]